MKSGRKVSLGTIINVSLFVALVTAGIYIYSFYRQKPPAPVENLIVGFSESIKRPPLWRTDIYGVNSSPLNKPMGVSVAPNGDIYVADSGNAQIQVFNSAGKWARRFGRYGQDKGQFDFPIDVLFRNGKVYVADLKNSRIQVFSPEGQWLGVIPDRARDPDLKVGPLSLATDAKGYLYVTTVNHEVMIFDDKDRFVRKFGHGGEGDGELGYPNGIAVAEDGTIWVADSNNGRIQMFTNDGRFLGKFNGGLSTPRGIAVRGDRVYVVDVFQHRVAVFDRKGTPLYEFGQRGVNEGTFNFPNDIFIDKNGVIYVTDRENNRISVWSY